MVGVGFLRRKKSSKSNLLGETALDRKGKVDGSSLLDGNGDPSLGTLYEPGKVNKKNAKKGSKAASNDENLHPDPNPMYPPPPHMGNSGYPQPGQPYPPAQHGQYPPDQQYQPQQQQWGNPQATQSYGQQYPPPPAPQQHPPNPVFSHTGQNYAPQPEGEKKKGRSWFGRKK